MKEKNSVITVGENDIKEEDIDALNLLLKQLSHEAEPVDLKWVDAVMQFGIIITLRDASKNNVLIGVGTLTLIRKLLAFYGGVEDVVVDEIYSRQGLGTIMMEMLHAKAKDLGMKFTDLTSNPNRIKANELYLKMGYERRNTNPYRYFLK